MNGSTLLLNALQSGDFSDKTIAATIDALREDRGVSLAQAVVTVARVHLAYVDAQEVAQAARLLSSASPIRTLLLRDICEALDTQPGSVDAVYTVPGEHAPRLLRRSRRGREASASRTVTVGARWLIDLARGKPWAPMVDLWIATVTSSAAM